MFFYIKLYLRQLLRDRSTTVATVARQCFRNFIDQISHKLAHVQWHI